MPRASARRIPVAILAAVATFVACTQPPRYDLVIAGGTVYDGSGEAPRRVDVAIRGDRIVAVGEPDRDAARRVIDATGLAVAPGFIDAEGDSATALLENGSLDSRVRQGVTTEVLAGSDSPALWSAATPEAAELRPFGITVDWSGLSGFARRLESTGLVHNVAPLVPATRLRRDLLGDSPRAPTTEELRRMTTRLDAALRAGAFGVSARLDQGAGRFTTREELGALARTTAQHAGVLAVHVRRETFGLPDAIAEIMAVAEANRVRPIVFDLKPGRWGEMGVVGPLFTGAAMRRLQAIATTAPASWRTMPIAALLPPVVAGAGPDVAATLGNPSLRAQARTALASDAWDNRALAAGWEGIEIIAVPPGADAMLVGRRLPAIAAARGIEPVDALLAIAHETGGQAVTEVQLVSPGAMSLLAGAPWVLFGTGARSSAGVVTAAAADLTRVAGPLVRDAGRLLLRHATSRLTSAPAHAFDIAGRGLVRAGAFADVVVFDPATIGDPPTPGATGTAAIPAVRYVLVNGVAVITPKGPTGARPGRVLTR